MREFYSSLFLSGAELKVRYGAEPVNLGGLREGDEITRPFPKGFAAAFWTSGRCLGRPRGAHAHQTEGCDEELVSMPGA